MRAKTPAWRAVKDSRALTRVKDLRAHTWGQVQGGWQGLHALCRLVLCERGVMVLLARFEAFSDQIPLTTQFTPRLKVRRIIAANFGLNHENEDHTLDFGGKWKIWAKSTETPLWCAASMLRLICHCFSAKSTETPLKLNLMVNLMLQLILLIFSLKSYFMLSFIRLAEAAHVVLHFMQLNNAAIKAASIQLQIWFSRWKRHINDVRQWGAWNDAPHQWRASQLFFSYAA
jgi:hypothetical protein